jgi:PAS domain S-box-containing protein
MKHGAPDRERGLLEALDALAFAERPEPALEAGLELLANSCGAGVAAVFLLEGGRVLSETWRCADPQAQSRRRSEFRRRAEESASELTRTESTADPACRVLPLVHDGKTLGVACLAEFRNEALEGEAGERMRFVVRLIASRIGQHRQITNLRASSSHYERWFKRLDDQLRVLDRERQKFAAVVNQSDTFVFVTDAERRIVWSSKGMGGLVGPGDESGWTGRSCSEVCSRVTGGPRSAPCGACAAGQAFDRNEVCHRELRGAAGGVTRSFYLTALPIKGPDGRPQEVMVMIQDLSDLQVLRRSESRYRTLFERSTDAIIMVDPLSHRVVLANPAATRLTGYLPDELLGRPLNELHPAEEWERVRGHFTMPPARDDRPGWECRIRTRSGKERLVHATATRYDLDDREVVMVALRDVTERRGVERALREVEERLSTVVAHLPIVLFAVDRDGTFTLSEGRGLEALGLVPGEVVGRSVFEVYREAPEVIACVQRALHGDPFTAILPVGDLSFETHYNPIRDAEGRVAGVIGVAVDITERRRLEEQLRHAQKIEAIGRLAGGVAHDFNNLLTAILGQSELLLQREDLRESQRRYVDDIHRAGARGALLTRQLLAFSRRDLQIARVLDLGAVLKDMEGMLRRLIGEDVELITEACPEPAMVKIDPGHIEQVIMNLAVNARDAMPRGGRLQVRVDRVEGSAIYAPDPEGRRDARFVRLSVSDNGHGMDAETRARLFEPFFTTKQPGQGTGLGLSIVYGIVLQSGGDIQVKSGKGLGTTVEVFLPLSEEAGAPSEVLPPLPALERGHETILLVEDDESVRPVVREILELQGYQVLEASDGVEALELAARHSGALHLVLSDVVMPQMSGGELGRRLAELRPEAGILYMSGNTEDSIVRYGVESATVAFIAKPFSLDGLARKVREVLDAGRTRQGKAA